MFSGSDSHIEVYMYEPFCHLPHKWEHNACAFPTKFMLVCTGCLDLFCLLQCQEQERLVDEGLYPHQFNPNMSLVGTHHSENLFHNNMCFSNVISCNKCATLF